MALQDYRLYNDAVYGHILLPQYIFPFIDTEEFQRLRRIKQLGPVSYVYEGATHNRFGHSIGVSYLANKMAVAIQQKFPNIGMTDRYVKLITIAGLLHDVGHGPYSHLFETVIRRCSGCSNYNHEDVSCKIIDRLSYLFETKEDVEFVKKVILGEPSDDKHFLYEIVSNPTTSIDVDKFDYFQRDAQYANIKTVCSVERFFINFSIINGHIVYPVKEYQNIYELFHTRYVLFKTVYFHKAVMQIDEMIVDALTTILKDINVLDLDTFLTLTDDILFVQPNKVVKRLETRKLYKTIWDTVVRDKKDVETIKELLKNENVVVSIRKLNFTSNTNPMEKVMFYDKNELVCVNENIMLMNDKFEEIIVRVIVKDTDKYETLKEKIGKILLSNSFNQNKIQYK